jgi:hypothetical protein
MSIWNVELAMKLVFVFAGADYILAVKVAMEKRRII